MKGLTLATAGVVLLASACGDRDRPGAAEVAVDTLEGGVVQVTSPREGLWSDGEGWELVEEVRIGAREGDGPDVFGSVADVAVEAERGRIHVLDSQADEVRVFDADGAHVSTLGGTGEGPGELANPMGLVLDSEGNLWVPDFGNGRYQVYAPGGEPLRSPARPMTFGSFPWPGGIDRDGDLWDVATAPGGDGALTRRALVRLHEEGADGGRPEPVDTLILPEHETETVDLVDDEGTRTASLNVPYAPQLRWRFDPRGYVWAAVTDRYRIAALDLRSGDTARVLEREHEPVPVTAEESDSVAELFEERVQGMAMGGRPERMPDIPDVKPALVNLHVDDHGRLWVEPSRLRGEAPRLEVFDDDGRFLGPVPLPEEVSRILDFAGSRLYALVQDDVGVPYVVAYRVQQP